MHLHIYSLISKKFINYNKPKFLYNVFFLLQCNSNNNKKEKKNKTRKKKGRKNIYFG